MRGEKTCEKKTMFTNISATCKEIQTDNGSFMYSLTSGRNRTEADCEASWLFPNETVVANAPPDPQVIPPAESVEPDWLTTNQCVRELQYRRDCISGFSEWINFHITDPTDSHPADSWSVLTWLLPLIIVFICLALAFIVYLAYKHRSKQGTSDRNKMDPGSEQASCDEYLL
ncbi:hypothetical protein MATL_G00129270 [Megalops atlanticus]|uniref:Uncharacterized protein n=1 Tax=Megalops atlanticus TaxID=7932 RepID=A0A9D3TAB8_MEGAT|nr:hypothetical protein MATL_G00129270 [Megalops atlanticus]